MTAPTTPAATASETIPGEYVLPDDYPIYGGYLYVADGKIIMSDYHGVTAAELKARIGATELRRCNISARQAIGLQVPL